ncbi:MAG: hypothetical protein QOD00_2285 [Blastocatellia bacterium]|nr:hypothetical protein [Blastocatellia bacterium]
MSAKLSVFFYILLCLEIGAVLTLMPWWSGHPFGLNLNLSDWGDNFFLVYVAHKTGIQGLQVAVSSGWVRGAVTGLGVLNLWMAVWETVHFRQTVQALQENHAPQHRAKDAAQPATTDPLSDYRGRNDAGHNSAE